MKPYLLGLYEKSMPGTLTLAEKLAETKTAGFDYMELSVDETAEKLTRLDWDNATINELVYSQQQTGIPIKSMCLSGHRRFPLGHPDTEIQRQSLNIMQKAITLSTKLGIRIIQIAGYDVYYEEGSAETRQTFAKNLALCVEMAAHQGVTLAFETMETEFLNTVEKAMHWVKAIPSPWLQVYPDVGNITNAALQYGTDVAEDLKSGAGHLAAIHLKETKPGIYREVPYGQGHVDFALVTGAAWRLGARMYVGEFWHTGEENWREILTQNNRFLRGVIEAAQSGQ